MTFHELHQHVQNWIDDFEQFPAFYSSHHELLRLNCRTVSQWNDSMLARVARMEMIAILIKSPVESKLNEAIFYAQTGDHEMMNKVYVRLLLVADHLDKVSNTHSPLHAAAVHHGD